MRILSLPGMSLAEEIRCTLAPRCIYIIFKGEHAVLYRAVLCSVSGSILITISTPQEDSQDVLGHTRARTSMMGQKKKSNALCGASQQTVHHLREENNTE